MFRGRRIHAARIEHVTERCSEHDIDRFAEAANHRARTDCSAFGHSFARFDGIAGVVCRNGIARADRNARVDNVVRADCVAGANRVAGQLDLHRAGQHAALPQ